ncbi:MAG: hypothetical protein R3Y56_04000 [Akkermansia sp.]
MWKKILIVALLLFLTATFAFYHANQVMTQAEGEIPNIQKLMSDTAARNRELATEARDKSYAELRQEWFDAETARLQEEKAIDDAESEEIEQKRTEITNALAEAEEEIKRVEADLKKVVADLVSAAGHESDAEDLSVVGDTLQTLSDNLEEKQVELAKEEASVKALETEEARLKALVAAGRKLNLDRQSRISPPELQCKVLVVDPNWSYIILDSGLDKGIVIGSRLAVMRGDVKICELNVTVVEKNRASADVVYNTLLVGDEPQAGDTVVSVRND